MDKETKDKWIAALRQVGFFHVPRPEKKPRVVEREVPTQEFISLVDERILALEEEQKGLSTDHFMEAIEAEILELEIAALHRLRVVAKAREGETLGLSREELSYFEDETEKEVSS